VAALRQISHCKKYPIGYAVKMPMQIIEQARLAAGLTQQAMAEQAGTSRSTLSAYERGRKSPNLETVERLIEVAGFELALHHRITFSKVDMARGRSIFVPDQLWRLDVSRMFEPVVLPLALNWSRPGHEYEVRDRRQRARLYEVVIREGMPQDLMAYIDGALLIDSWNELVLPRNVRVHWQSLIETAS
jgi:transcriptional regulator with XRE-family HTH domain